MADIDFAEQYGPWALIAGGSEGVGASFAHRLAERGLDLILVARKPEPLEALAAEIRSRHGREVRSLPADLTSADVVARIAETAAGCDIGMMVYNAGADDRVATFLERPIELSERLVALNILTPMRLVRHLAPAMTRRGKGGIILLSSFASCAGTPGNLVYSSTKAFSNIFAEGLWYELGQHGVHVLGLIIGITRTPAMERMGLTFDGVAVPAEPDDLVDEALEHLGDGPTCHAGGTHEDAHRLRSLPRAEAVNAMASFSDAATRTKG